MYALAVSTDSTGAANATKRDFLISSSLVTSRWSVVMPAGPAVARARLLPARVRVHLALKRRIRTREPRPSPLAHRRCDFRTETGRTCQRASGWSAERDRERQHDATQVRRVTLGGVIARKLTFLQPTRTTNMHTQHGNRLDEIQTSIGCSRHIVHCWRIAPTDSQLEPRSTRGADIAERVTYPHPLRRGRRTSWAAAAAAAWA